MISPPGWAACSRASTIAEEGGRAGVTDGERGRQGENPVAQIFHPAAPQRGGASHVGDVVAPVVQHPEKPAEPSQPSVAGAETGADLEHRSGVLGGDGFPVLEPERPSTQPPLQAFRHRQSLHELAEELARVDVGRHEIEASRGQVAGSHPRRQGPEAAVQGQPAPSIA
jgi:hypothetical protein